MVLSCFLDLQFFILEGVFELFKLVVESGDFNLVLVLKSAYLISIESFNLGFLRFKSLKLSRELLIACLELFLELIEAFRHAILLEVGI